MNVKRLLVIFAILAAAGTAIAQQAEDKNHGYLGSGAAEEAAANQTREQSGPQAGQVAKGSESQVKTRAEVMAELEQAEKDGTLQTASFAGFRNPTEDSESKSPEPMLAHK